MKAHRKKKEEKRKKRKGKKENIREGERKRW